MTKCAYKSILLISKNVCFNGVFLLLGEDMENNKRITGKDLHFITGFTAFIDEIRYNHKIMLVRAKDPEIVGVAVVQGDERHGYEFLMLSDRYDFEDFAEELRENGYDVSMVELPDDRSISLKANYLVGDIKAPTYKIDIDKERKVLQVEYFPAEDAKTLELSDDDAIVIDM